MRRGHREGRPSPGRSRCLPLFPVPPLDRFGAVRLSGGGRRGRSDRSDPRTWKHEIAERASCDTCGTLLWFKDHDGPYELQVGLFDAAKDYPLISEIYTDCAFAAVTLAGDHKRATAAEYEAKNQHVEPAP